MEKVLTLVIPAYNSQVYLSKVLDSLLEPSAIPYLDVIVVNDGSTDHTAAVCEAYCQKYPESIRLITQTNKGHGGALNTGFAAAVGKYIKPIDSDDWVETQNLPEFINFLRKCESDVVLTQFNSINITDNTVTKWRSHPEEFGREYSLREIVADWGKFNQITVFHGVTYRTEFYRSIGLHLTEHVFYEDEEYCIIPFSHAKTIVPVDLVIYNYRVGDAGQSTSEENLRKNISHFQKVLNKLIQQYRESISIHDDAAKLYYCLMVKSMLANYLSTIMLMNKNRKQGRRQAAAVMKETRQKIPSAYWRALLPYHALRIMNYLGISKQRCDQLLCSDFYARLRRRKPVDVENQQSAATDV